MSVDSLYKIPNDIVVKTIDDYSCEFILEPLENGFGTTLGNSLRRVLLSSVDGYAITAIRIPGVLHEFATIDGVIETCIDIILNLKTLRFKLISNVDDLKKENIHIKVDNATVLKGSDITLSSAHFEVINGDVEILHTNDPVTIEMDVIVEIGKGYVQADEHFEYINVKGVVPIDSIFSPIINVKFAVSELNTGNYESLSITVTTDGSITPKIAINKAVLLLMKHYEKFYMNNNYVAYQDIDYLKVFNQDFLDMKNILSTSLSDFEISVRAANCLKGAEIKTVKDLVVKTETELSTLKNCGKKSLDELKNLVANLGLSFGMDVSKYKL